jgi:hypothetical protein
MQAVTLSDAALSLLKLYAKRGDIPVDDTNRDTCRELAAAGLVVVGHSFSHGREAFYRCTEAGWAIATSLSESAAPRP